LELHRYDFSGYLWFHGYLAMVMMFVTVLINNWSNMYDFGVGYTYNDVSFWIKVRILN